MPRPSAIIEPQVGSSVEIDRLTKDQDRLDDDSDPHFQRKQDEDRRRDIGQHFAQHDAHGSVAGDLGAIDIVHPPLLHRLGRRDAAEPRPVDDGDRDNDRRKTRAHDRDKQDRKQHGRKGHPDVDETRNDAIGPAAEEAGGESESEPNAQAAVLATMATIKAGRVA